MLKNKIKSKSTKQIISDIDIKITGLTHDIKTLEGFAKELLKLRLEIDAIRNSFRKYKEFKGCNFVQCIPTKCSMEEMINNKK